jgi:hypothetical protein
MLRSKKVRIVDNLVLFFWLLFLASLTNSIFINQVGYYGVLLLLLFRYYLTKESAVEKTGIEYALLWFIAAEIFSLIVSLNQSQSFLYVTRRILLMPLIYVAASVTDLKRAKLFFWTFIAAAVITSLVYIVFSYKYFIANLYAVKQSGPSLFQYPITSSEILSILSVFLFAFLINEKTDLKTKLLTALALLISLIALAATYKRTGWIGAGFGFFLIIFLKRDWKYVIPLLLLIVLLFVFQRNINEIKIFSVGDNKLQLLNSFNTGGRAYDLTSSAGNYYVSDYEGGLLKYSDSRQLNKIDVPSPIISLQKWNDYYLGNFADTRFITYKKDLSGDLKVAAECLPPGFTIGYALNGNFLYTLDMDSGLTVYEDPLTLKSIYRNNLFANYRKALADSDLILFFSPDSGLQFYKLINGVPASLLYSFKPTFSVNSIFYLNRKLYVSGNDGIKTYFVTEDSVHLLSNYDKPGKIFFWKETDNKIIAADQSGNIFIKDVNSPSDFMFLGKTDFTPASVTLMGDTLIASYVKRSRLLSIWDPYLPANSVRLSLWKAGWKIFLDHPVFGVGDIDLAVLYKQYKSKYDKEIQGHMHNNFVHMLVILGTFGFLAFCYLLFRLIKIDLRIYRDVKNVPFASSYALGTIAALSAVIIAGLTEMNFFDHEITTLLWFTFGLNIAVWKHYKKNT